MPQRQKLEYQPFKNFLLSKVFQDTLNHSATLVYYYSNKTLWIDLDASKEFGFGAVIFHIAIDKALPNRRWPSKSFFQLIYFFSRLLIAAEKNYWLTKLKIAGFV